MVWFLSRGEIKEVNCKVCGHKSPLITTALPVCRDCLKKKSKQVRSLIAEAHARARRPFSLPAQPPRDKKGVKCTICTNQCQIGLGKKGFCGLRTNREGRLVHLAGNIKKAVVSWYYDPLPTNCVAEWVCAGGSETGHPAYSYAPGTEYGYKNLAVFLGACCFDCLFCQNWHYREMTQSLSPTASPKQLVEAIDSHTSCICFFGGDPTVQSPWALAASRLALKKHKNKILRICWETDGAMNIHLARKMASLSLVSGGCIKFDLKAYDEQLNQALTGISNKQTLRNFTEIAKLIGRREEPPLLVASTLLIPGYVEAEEVSKLAHFIAKLNPEIPYSLLAFYPAFEMNDMPTTSRKQAEECKEAALEAGLKRIKIGNVHLLS